jgi:hypothetical protein
VITRTPLITVELLDRHIAFLQREAHQVRQVGKRWADDKADKYDEIAEVLRVQRQNLQMQGVAGRVGQ